MLRRIEAEVGRLTRSGKRLAEYHYYIVESSFVARVKGKWGESTDRLTDEGQWVPYHDLWEVTVNGREVSEEEAMDAATFFADRKVKREMLAARESQRTFKESSVAASHTAPIVEIVLEDGEWGAPHRLKPLASASADSIRLRLRANQNQELAENAARRLAELPGLGSVDSLYLDMVKLKSPAVRALFATRYFTRLHMLTFSYCELGAEGSRAFAESIQNDQLESLTISTDRIGEEGARALAVCPLFGKVKQLSLYNSWMGDEGMMALAASRNFPSLENLNVGSNGLSAKGVRALAGSTCFPRLQSLSLWDLGITDGAVEALEDLPHMPELASLSMGHKITDGGLRLVAGSERLARLRNLSLTNNLITDEGVRALVTSPRTFAFRTLSFFMNQITDEGARLLAGARNLPYLETLDLRCNQITAAGTRQLVESPTLAGIPHLLV
jgi:Leucine-rich repeat (LRR) protein